MVTKKTWLIDVWETLFSIDFDALLAELSQVAKVPHVRLRTSAQRFTHPVTVGEISGVDAFTQAALDCGADSTVDLRSRVAETAWSFLSTRTHVFQDTVSFIERRRRQGDLVAYLSNCGEDTRPLLEANGLLDVADGAVLSCEIGVGKPDRGIYEYAANLLDIAPEQATLVDDQIGFCAGAVAAGMNAIQLVRDGAPGSNPTIPTVRSFDEI